METMCKQQHLQRSYLSSHHYKLHPAPKIMGLQKQIPVPVNKQRTYRAKTYNIDSLSQHQADQVRKNSYSAIKKCKPNQRNSNQSKCTPYQSRKNNQKLLFKDKQQKIIVQLRKIPFKLQQSKNNWLIVKQALSNGRKSHLKSQNASDRCKRQHLKSEASSQRINIDLSDINCEQQQLKDVKQHPIEEKNKSIKRMLSYYKNKNNIKRNLQVTKLQQRTENKEQINLHLKLSAISNNINQAKQSLKSYLYSSKRQITIKSKTKNIESPIVTEQLKNNLISSTHSEHIEKICNDSLKGVLNSFKVDMKQKQILRARPKTASKVLKTNVQLIKKNNRSQKKMEMTGWQDEPDKYEKDILFFS